jgi:hypothetical protein
MPPLPLLVLDSMVDDAESIETLRDHGAVALRGLALVHERDVIAAVRSLLAEGLAEALEIDASKQALIVVASPLLDAASLRAYWFRPTPAGKQVWRGGEAVLDAYWKANPIDD